MTKKFFWSTISIFSALSGIFLACGFSLGISDIFNASPPIPADISTPKLESSTPDGLVVGLGDSLIRGTGDAKGNGVLGYAYQQLKKKNPNMHVVNLGISGQTSSQLVKQIQTHSIQQTLKEANWIVLSIGGNDLFQKSDRLKNTDGREFQKERRLYQKNLTEILRQIRLQNQTAPVFMIGLYNPFSTVEEGEDIRRIVSLWNQTLEKVALQYTYVSIIPTYDLFQFNPRPYLYSDRFHPNHVGYQKISTRLYQAMQPTLQTGE